MFVIRFLLATLAIIGGTLVWGSTSGYSAWQIAGLAFLAVLLLQMLIVCYVVFDTIRNARGPSLKTLQQGAQESRDQIVILPR